MDQEIVIKVEDLGKSYVLKSHNSTSQIKNEFWAIKNVSFEIKKGQRIGIIGPNGSGKSTLLKILAGVTKPTKGKIKIKGRVASILDIGAGFHPELNGRENIFLNGQILGFTKEEIKKKYNQIIEFSGIHKFIMEPVKNYSNGMYLRLAFSIMAHLDFDIYLFDEVFSVGDAEFYNKSREKLNHLFENSKTMIFVSHNINEMENMDAYYLFEKGNLTSKSQNFSLIDQYLEQATHLNEINNLHTQNNFKTLDFSKYQVSKDIKMIEFEFLQEGSEPFRTDKPFFLKIIFEKLTMEGTIDPLFKIRDIKGMSLLTSAPHIKNGFNQKLDLGTYTFICEIPAYFFKSTFYSIDIIFLKNSHKKLNYFLEEKVNDLKRYTVQEEPSYKLKNIFTFKPLLNNPDIEGIGKNIKIPNFDNEGSSSLTPGFSWSIKVRH